MTPLDRANAIIAQQADEMKRMQDELDLLRANDPTHRGLCAEFEALLPIHPHAHFAPGVTGLWLERLKTMRAFVERIAKQRPEKPDYWCSCGQCEHNADDAKEMVGP